MKMIKKVRLVFADVNYPTSARSIKESVILADYDELLCDLMQECMKKGNYKTMQTIIRLVRSTNWHVEMHCERVADIAESMCYGLKTIEDDVTFELPCFVETRVLRVVSAIMQAVGFQAKQWQEALPLNNNKASLQSLYDDLCEMEDYCAQLYDLLTRLGCNYCSSSYTGMRMDALNLIADARRAVQAKLDACASIKN